MPIVKACKVCGRPGASRCADHPRVYDQPAFRRQRQALRSAPRVCWRCGGGPRDGDPFVAGHLVDVVLGSGDGTVANEHRSCNARAGQLIAGPRR